MDHNSSQLHPHSLSTLEPSFPTPIRFEQFCCEIKVAGNCCQAFRRAKWVLPDLADLNHEKLRKSTQLP